MNKKLMLVVEDEERMVALVKDALDEWNDANEADQKVFQAIFVASVEEAMEAISNSKIDCALVDLRLPLSEETGKTNADNGNRLAAELLRKTGIPVAIISGNIGEAEPALVDGKTIKAFEKAGDGYEDAVGWLGEQWELMKALKSVRRKLEASTAEVFARRIWPNWEQIIGSIGHDQETLVTVIARQYASHTAELLGQNSEGSWHPFESYIVPSYLDDRAHTGDVFTFNGLKWIVLTPQCDMATGKVQNVLLAECQIGPAEWEQKVTALKAATNDDQKKKPTRFLMDHVNQNLPASKHFLPPIPGTNEPLLVQFGSVQTMPLEELNKQLADRSASVSPPFLSNLVQRFGSYISRTGQPNIGAEHF